MIMKQDEDKGIYTSESLRREMNEERRRQGESEIQAINPRGTGTGTLARKDKSWKSIPDFFLKVFKKNS